MNRHERRAAKKRGDAIFVDYGYLFESDQNYGRPVHCSVCGVPHKNFGFARIQDNQSGTIDVALCEPCRAASDSAAIVRKFRTDLPIFEGGKATTEQVLAMAEKQDAREH